MKNGQAKAGGWLVAVKQLWGTGGALGMVALAEVLLTTGCATPKRYEDHARLFAQGMYRESLAPFAEREGKPGARRYSLDDMSSGSGHRALQEWKASNKAFDRAETGIKEQQDASMAGTAVNQVSAVFANDNAMPYQVQEYDGIMVNVYKALNELQQGEVDRARVEFKRVEERQRMAAENFKKQIAKMQAEEKKHSASAPEDAGKAEGGLRGQIRSLTAERFGSSLDAAKSALQDDKAQRGLAQYQEQIGAKRWGAMDAFTNPFGTFMHGVFLYCFGEDQSDAESAAFFFKRASEGSPESIHDPKVRARMLAEASLNGRLQQDIKNQIVFVVFENGLGPAKTEWRLPLWIPVRLDPAHPENTQVVNSTLVLPQLVERGQAFPYLSVCAGSKELAKTEVICSMDAVVAAEFRERYPLVLSRNLVQCVVKDILQAVIVNELDKRGIPRMVSSPVLGVLFDATKHADTRIWASLPKEFQAAVVKRPESGQLSLFVPGAIEPLATVDIPEGGPAIVFIQTPAPNVRPNVDVVSAAFRKP